MAERKLPVRVIRKEVNLAGFEGWWAEFSLDLTVDEMEVLEQMPDFASIKDILAEHILDWNFVDKKGRELPKPKNNPKAIGRLTPLLLVWCAATLVTATVEELPFPELGKGGRLTSPSGKPLSVKNSAGRQANSEEKDTEKS